MEEPHEEILNIEILDKKESRLRSYYKRHKTNKERSKALSKLTFQEYIDNRRSVILERNNLIEFFYLYSKGKKRLNFDKMASQYLSVNFVIDPKYIENSVIDQKAYIELKKKVKKYFNIIYQELEI